VSGLDAIGNTPVVRLDRLAGDGAEVWVKAGPSNVAASFLSGQYYFDRGGVQIAPEPGDYVIDGGGCLGDTALAFAADVGATGRVYTFDPMLRHCEIMREAFQMNPRLASHIELFDVGLADGDSARDASHSTPQAVNPGARLEEGLPTRTIDGLVSSNEIERIDLIKMDIEGSEPTALRGMTRLLAQERAPPVVFESNGHTLHLLGQTPETLLDLHPAPWELWVADATTGVGHRAWKAPYTLLGSMPSTRNASSPRRR